MSMMERLRAEREEQIAFVQQILEHANADERDLVPAEQANVAGARERVAQIDAQLTPMVEFEEARAAGSALLSRISDAAAAGGGGRRPAGGGDAAMTAAAQGFGYASAGAFILDKLRAVGVPVWGWNADPAAAERVAAAQRHQLANQTTGETPGLLPKPIIGPIVSSIDNSRPFMTSIGVKPLQGIPGKTFSRPKITTRTQSGKQAAELAPLASRAMVISPVDFTKETHGGFVDVSRQDIDWTVPAAWDALVQDLADSYGEDVEASVAAAFIAGLDPLNEVDLPSAAPTLEDWMLALYDAAGKVYAGCKRLPDMYWCSIDMWGALGALTDVARLQNSPGGSGNMGESSLARFSGNLLELPRIVVPSFPAGKLVVGASTKYEIYEEQIGLVSAVTPSNLGVQVAYGGYCAGNFLEAKGFSNVNRPLVVGAKASA